MKEIKINIGAGTTYIPGFVNIDISSKADITLDLNKDRLPFENDSVDLVFSYHTLEHVHDYLFALSEIHRVCKHRGHFLVGLPYVSLTKYHLVNPYHFHSFSEYSFDFFDVNKLKGSAAEENRILFKTCFIRFHYIGIFHLIPPPFRFWCRRHLFNVVRKIDFGLLAVKDYQESISINSEDRRILKKKFINCLKARVPYEHKKTQTNKKVMSVYNMLKSTWSWWDGTSY